MMTGWSKMIGRQLRTEILEIRHNVEEFDTFDRQVIPVPVEYATKGMEVYLPKLKYAVSKPLF